MRLDAASIPCPPLRSPTRAGCAILLALLAAAPALSGQEGGVNPARVYEPAELSTLPRLINLDELRAALQAGYPPELRAAGVEGTVAVSLIVNLDGTPDEIAVVESTHPGFDSVTLATAANLRFSAAVVEGRPVRTRVQIPIQWRLPQAAAVPLAVSETATATPRGVIRRLPPSPAAEDGEADDGMRTYELSGVDVQPRPLNIPMLRAALERNYPEELRAMGLRGTVQVRFRVDTEGKPSRFSITSSTNATFDRPTLDAVRQLRFTPAQVNGRRVAVWVELPIAWNP